jgi:hypothetical protein
MIDPAVWYTEREVLNHAPKHFIKVKTALTEESKAWILNNLKGRFTTVHSDLYENSEFDILVQSLYGYPAFEDPKEAIMFELTWG